MAKYVTIIDHLVGQHDLGFSHLSNPGKTKLEAIVYATAQGLKQEEVYCILVGKRIEKNTYQIFFRINADGSSEDFTKTKWNGWGKEAYKWKIFDCEFKAL